MFESFLACFPISDLSTASNPDSDLLSVPVIGGFVSCFTIQSVRCPQPVKKNISDWNLSSIQLLGFERSLDVRMMAPSTLTAKGSECQQFYQTKLVFGTWSGTLEAKMKGETFSNFYFVPYMKYINTINYIRNLISDYNGFHHAV